MSTKAAAMAAYLAVITAAIGVTSAVSYTNHTVGGPPPSGWYFNSTSSISSTNYSVWAATQTFNLGDYLIFNTNTNQTVVQTYNSNTYNNCTSDDSSDNDTLVFNSGATKFDQPLTISVPLTKVGPNYFFSDAEDGVQCQHGMRFDIQVGQGLGLPPSLNQPPPPLYTPPPMAEPPPAFQGESMYNGVERLADGIFGVAVIWACLIVLGLSFVIFNG